MYSFLIHKLLFKRYYWVYKSYSGFVINCSGLIKDVVYNKNWGDSVNKEQFNNLDFMEKIEYLNNKLREG